MGPQVQAASSVRGGAFPTGATKPVAAGASADAVLRLVEPSRVPATPAGHMTASGELSVNPT